MAAWQGHREAVQLLINHGADVSAMNKVRYAKINNVRLRIKGLKSRMKFINLI
jgi:ankyrin repeat protein